MIQLGESSDGRLIIVSNERFAADVARVVWYDNPRMMVLELEDGTEKLMTSDVSDAVRLKILHAPEEIVVAMALEGEDPFGYDAQLVRVD